MPTNHLDFTPSARQSPRRGSVNHVYRKAGDGSWKSGSQCAAQPAKNTARVAVAKERPPKNDPNHWKSQATSSEVRHNGKNGLILGETDGVAIVQYDDGLVEEVPSKELIRVAGTATATPSATTHDKTVRTTSVKKKSSGKVPVVLEKRYLTERAIDGIRIDPRSGKVRKAKAAVPGQAKLDAFRGKSRSGMSAKKKKGPPPRPVRKKWPIVRT